MRALTHFFVAIVRKYLPDAFVFAIALTFIAYVAAVLTTGKGAIEIIGYWGQGLWGILAFSMQMMLILLTGHSLASSKPVKKFLSYIASFPKNGVQAAMVTVLISGLANFLNWGFGLVVAALLAREMAKKVKNADYGFLVAAGYSGFVIWHGGISGSIPLAIASAGNLVEQYVGVIPVSQTIFSLPNFLMMFGIIFTLPTLFYFIAPRGNDIVPINPELLEDDAPVESSAGDTIASKLENSSIVTYILCAMGFVYLADYFSKKGFNLDLNIVIMIFMWLGMLLHKTPVNYVNAFSDAIKGASGIALQFPLYGGIQGIMIHSGMAALIAKGFIAVSTKMTFPLFTFLAGGLINMFIPSGGGQWIVQGPINIPAALELGVEPRIVAMAISYGDSWTNMIQPFWALPLLGIAKLGVRDIMGYCVMTLLWSGSVIGTGILIWSAVS